MTGRLSTKSRSSSKIAPATALSFVQHLHLANSTWGFGHPTMTRIMNGNFTQKTAEIKDFIQKTINQIKNSCQIQKSKRFKKNQTYERKKQPKNKKQMEASPWMGPPENMCFYFMFYFFWGGREGCLFFVVFFVHFVMERCDFLGFRTCSLGGPSLSCMNW